MGVPNLANYFHAAQLSMLTKYHVLTETPLWIDIEREDSPTISVYNKLWVLPCNRGHIHNLITTLSLRLWGCLKITRNLLSPRLPLQSIKHNPTFLLALTSPSSFQEWTQRNKIKKLITLTSLPPSEFFAIYRWNTFSKRKHIFLYQTQPLQHLREHATLTHMLNPQFSGYTQHCPSLNPTYRIIIWIKGQLMWSMR